MHRVVDPQWLPEAEGLDKNHGEEIDQRLRRGDAGDAFHDLLFDIDERDESGRVAERLAKLLEHRLHRVVQVGQVAVR